MRRFHLFEFEDLAWFPKLWRDMMTDILQIIMRDFKIYDPAASLIQKLIAQVQDSRIVDLCSGGSGPWLKLHELMEADGHQPHLLLTDKYPNIETFEYVMRQSAGKINYYPHSVDALDIPSKLEGIRTFFNAFHHFRPPVARRILQNAIDNRAPIAIFENTERQWFNLIIMFFLTPFFVWFLTTPFIRPFKLSRVFWTYIIPIVPIALTWDNLVSHTRTYSPDELRALIDGLEGHETYEWEIGQYISPKIKSRVTYLLAYPREK
jgi:hypothetical protein